MGTVVGVEPSVLKWARESSGYTIDEVARKLGREAQAVYDWEDGSAAPTYSQLETLAYEVYKRPLAAFFLPSPPSDGNVDKQFRTLPNSELERLQPDTRYQLRLAYAYQRSLWELHGGVNPATRQIFRDFRRPMEFADIGNVAGAIREYLGVTIEAQAEWKSDDIAVKLWRDAIQDAGVYVFKHSFRQKEISGFCLVDDVFPIIYINNSTTKTRQIFSLFHELCHLLIGVDAISEYDTPYLEELATRERHVEQFCNMVTAEVLIPSDDFRAHLKRTRDYGDESIQRLARRYHVSREAILRRVLDMGLVSKTYYESKARQWAAEADKRKPDGGNYYATTVTYLGERYLLLVMEMHRQGRLTAEQAADHLGVKVKSLSRLEDMALRGGATV